MRKEMIALVGARPPPVLPDLPLCATLRSRWKLQGKAV